MWDLQSTAAMLKSMSQCTNPRELVRICFDYIWRNFDVHRALVVTGAGLSFPQYRLVHNISCNDRGSEVIELNQTRQGGLLAELLQRGEFQNIPNFVPDAADPAFALLQGSKSLMAFPLFQNGAGTGMVVALGPSASPHDSAELCALATMTSLLGRAIESQKLANELNAACHALDSELKAAADVQRWLLPSLPALDDISTRIAASYRTSKHSGGDYYDIVRLPDRKLGVLIADVSGKGAAAAVLMAVLRSIVHDEVDRTEMIGPAALLNYADCRLRDLALSERGAFVTAFCGVLDTVSGELVYSCAGHNPPRLLDVQNRAITALDGAVTFPLGLIDELHTHTEATAWLMPGDLAILYTDGITEARNEAGDFFGVEGLDQLLNNLLDPITPDAVVASVGKALARFAGSDTPTDDQTLVALGRCSARPSNS